VASLTLGIDERSCVARGSAPWRRGITVDAVFREMLERYAREGCTRIISVRRSREEEGAIYEG
jgi:hypothetical protein